MANDYYQRYTLMHKNVPVVEMVLDNATGSISAIGEIYELAHVPVGAMVKKGRIDRAALNEWWKSRAIPASRDGIKSALIELNVTSTQKLLDKCLGLSLSDQYWICPVDSGISWESVNFFQNDFSDDVGNILFGKGSSSDKISLMSPDNTSDGWLKKKWKIIDEKRCLIKGGSAPAYQEPYNEVIASCIMERLNIPHVPYTLMIQEDYPYSVCADFITPKTELISAWYVMQTQQKENHISVYQHYLNCCKALNVPDIKEALDQMMVLDYLIVNEDRHQNNFGVVRNAETLEYLGAAPIFDSGTSLWFNQFTHMIGRTKISSKPFKNRHEEQIKLVSSFDWLDLKVLDGIDEQLRELMRGSLFIDDARSDALCSALKERVESLTEVVNDHKIFVPMNNCHGDVAEDIAYSGDQEDFDR
ncbi:excisionase [Eubacterium sp. 1001713B170207_170306_E7]|uniref:excisionase n=1 Tax=Eubacterium sp. 1001713B170207_170306_E7 TaxID=2787097 RepID=UPI001897AC6F|nr:excisionase [Eubacterium sp. 1001713B170207_170306_E7]